MVWAFVHFNQYSLLSMVAEKICAASRRHLRVKHTAFNIILIIIVCNLYLGAGKAVAQIASIGITSNKNDTRHKKRLILEG
jgi:hypothetical protein